ncbi:BspA family leucine-rich repeat surface protein [bacterium]|nr:BspA family leucine-rich repeat surface protein [bacterium]
MVLPDLSALQLAATDAPKREREDDDVDHLDLFDGMDIDGPSVSPNEQAEQAEKDEQNRQKLQRLEAMRLEMLPDDLVIKIVAQAKLDCRTLAKLFCGASVNFRRLCLEDAVFWKTMCDARKWTSDKHRAFYRQNNPELFSLETVEAWKAYYVFFCKRVHTNWTLKGTRPFSVRDRVIDEYDHRWFGPIEIWDTSEVTDMSGMFSTWRGGNSTFNRDISAWDTSKVEDMSEMFHGSHCDEYE